MSAQMWWSQICVVLVLVILFCGEPSTSQFTQPPLFSSSSSTLSTILNSSNSTNSTNSSNNFPNSTNLSINSSTISTNPTNVPFAVTPQPFTTPSFVPYVTRQPPQQLINGQTQIKVGLLFSNNSEYARSLMGYGQSAPAIQLALRRIQAEQLIPSLNLSFYWYMDNCEESLAAGYASRLIMNDNVNAIIGPACPKSMISAASIASFNNVPLILWGPPFPSELADSKRFPTVMSTTISTNSVGIGILNLMQEFEWKEFALIYTQDESVQTCDYVQLGIANIFDDQNVDINITYKRSVINTTSSFTQILQVIKQKARVVVMCFDNNSDIRRFLLAAYDLGMYDEEYVYVLLTVNTQGGLVKTNGTLTEFWKTANNTDGRDNDALIVAKKSILFGIGLEDSNQVAQFDEDVIKQFNQAPFYCDSYCMGQQNQSSTYQSSTYSRYLYDAVYLYALALNRTLETGSVLDIQNGAAFAANGSFSFNGTTGQVEISKNGTRQPLFQIAALNSNNTLTTYAKIAVYDFKTLNVSFTKLYTDANGIWSSRDGQPPTGKPKCGYTGYECALSTGLIIGVSVGAFVLLLVVGVIVVGYFWRERVKYQSIQKLEWEIPYIHLTKVEERAMENMKSIRSVQSMTSGNSRNDENLTETENHCFFYYKKSVVYANKHPIRVKLTKSDVNMLRQLRNFDHDNANRFVGLCVDGPIIYSVWKYCQRGSLQDVLLKEGFVRDQFVVFALMRDISNGLNAIHNSYVEVHGALSSDCCLINDRWQVKIGNFGLGIIRDKQVLRKKDCLWTAPELLRDDNLHGTKAGDVFSYAIICSELLNRECAWNGAQNDDEIDDILHKLKRGGSNPLRPAIQPPDEVNENIINLVRDCWDERPENRPEMGQVIILLKQILNNGKHNLMDYVFSMLEQYASSLENEVELRTKELMEEKRKSDILLYRMLPQQVADKLKMGMVVEPESFDNVTVFFSDVVSFTSLAGLCTPLQVVNLLNDLYTVFDGIIEQCDAYKLETIGDGYLVCSGLPRRNGNKHVVEIAQMSIEFLKSLQSFRIPHLPQYRINIRVGFHTGPCVAGVVGLSMPKYCLFGDTINTASRMESNSKPGKIHISSSANHYLLEENEGYVTESRGEILIKGKGMMETFWLVGKGQSIDSLIDRIPSTPSTDRLFVTEDEAVSPHIVANPAVTITQMSRSQKNANGTTLYTEYLDYSKN